MKKNAAEKYFRQKSWSLLEIICIIVTIIAAVVATVVPGGIPIGVPIMAGAVIILVFSKSAKIKDAEIDTEFNKLVANNIDVTKYKHVVQCFDLSEHPVVKGRDGKLRSSKYVVSVFDFGGEDTEITVYDLDVIANRVTVNVYQVPKDREITLVEEVTAVSGGRKTLRYLVCDSFFPKIPVNTDDMDTCHVIEKVCKSNGMYHSIP